MFVLHYLTSSLQTLAWEISDGFTLLSAKEGTTMSRLAFTIRLALVSLSNSFSKRNISVLCAGTVYYLASCNIVNIEPQGAALMPGANLAAVINHSSTKKIFNKYIHATIISSKRDKNICRSS